MSPAVCTVIFKISAGLVIYEKVSNHTLLNEMSDLSIGS